MAKKLFQIAALLLVVFSSNIYSAQLSDFTSVTSAWTHRIYISGLKSSLTNSYCQSIGASKSHTSSSFNSFCEMTNGDNRYPGGYLLVFADQYEAAKSSYGEPLDPPTPSQHCTDLGKYWYDNFCNDQPSSDTAEQQCIDDLKFWYNDTCNDVSESQHICESAPNNDLWVSGQCLVQSDSCPTNQVVYYRAPTGSDRPDAAAFQGCEYELQQQLGDVCDSSDFAWSYNSTGSPAGINQPYAFLLTNPLDSCESEEPTDETPINAPIFPDYSSCVDSIPDDARQGYLYNEQFRDDFYTQESNFPSCATIETSYAHTYDDTHESCPSHISTNCSLKKYVYGADFSGCYEICDDTQEPIDEPDDPITVPDDSGSDTPDFSPLDKTGLYTKTDKTFNSVLTDFNVRVSQSPVISSAMNFFQVNISGECPIFVIPEVPPFKSTSLDFLCSEVSNPIWFTASAVILALASYVAFRWAFL